MFSCKNYCFFLTILLVPIATTIVLAQSSSFNKYSACQHNPERGNCGGRQLRWYYDPQQYQCFNFTYSGCQGNPNRFTSFEECMQRCDGVYPNSNSNNEFTSTPFSPRSDGSCNRPSDTGCAADAAVYPLIVQRYYYDHNSGSGDCVAFYYCKPNWYQIGFETKSQCRQHCSHHNGQGTDSHESWYDSLRRRQALEGSATSTLSPSSNGFGRAFEGNGIRNSNPYDEFYISPTNNYARIAFDCGSPYADRSGVTSLRSCAMFCDSIGPACDAFVYHPSRSVCYLRYNCQNIDNSNSLASGEQVWKRISPAKVASPDERGPTTRTHPLFRTAPQRFQTTQSPIFATVTIARIQDNSRSSLSHFTKLGGYCEGNILTSFQTSDIEECAKVCNEYSTRIPFCNAFTFFPNRSQCDVMASCRTLLGYGTATYVKTG